MESNKLLIQSRGKPAIIKSINVKVPGAFSRKGIGPIMAPSANLYEHIDIQQRTQISRRHHVNIPRRSSFHLNNYFIKQNNSHIINVPVNKKNKWNNKTSIPREAPQVFLNSTAKIGNNNSNKKKNARQVNLLRKKERHHYGFLNVRDLKLRSTAIEIKIKTIADQDYIRKKRIDDVKRKIHAVKEQLRYQELYKKRLLNTINNVSRRLFYGKNKMKKTQVLLLQKYNAPPELQRNNLSMLNIENEVVRDNDGEDGFFEPKIALPSPPKMF